MYVKAKKQKLPPPINNYDITITDAVYNLFEKDRDTIFKVAFLLISKIDDREWGFVNSDTWEANNIVFENKTGIINARYLVDYNFLIVSFNINNRKMLIHLESEIQ